MMIPRIAVEESSNEIDDAEVGGFELLMRTAGKGTLATGVTGPDPPEDTG